VKKESGGGKKKRRKENPYASTGLDRFAILVEELQAKRLAMVDKTAMSVSAVRSLSKSAQEWTASTLSTRTTATKRSSRITEQQLLLSKAPDAATRNEVSFQVAQKTEEEGAKQEGQQQQEGRMIQQQECAHESSVVVAPREEADSRGVITSEIAAELVPPLKMTKRTIKTARRMGGRTGGSLGLRGSCVLLRDKAAASKAAVAVLVAVGAFFASKRAEWGKHVADAMSFSIVIRRWRHGKLYARFMFSAMASYVLTHLHSYLSVQRPPPPPPPLPKRLTFFASSAALQKRVEEEEEQQQQQEKDQEAETSSMEQQEQQEISSFAMPILPAAAASSPPAAAAEIESSSNPPLPIISPTKTAKGSSSDKLSLKFKSRFVKSFHLSNVAPGGGSSSTPPMNSPGRLLATPPPPSSSSSGNKHIVAPGSSPPSLEIENSDSNTVSSPSSSRKSEGVGRMGGDDAAAPTRHKEGGKKFCFSRKPKTSSESLAIEKTSRQKLSSYKRSKPPNGKNKSSIAANGDEVVVDERSFTTMAADVSSSGLRKIRTMRSVVGLPTVAEERRETKMHSSSSSSLEGREESWLLCGLLLVALLFLLVDRVAAILATSFFLLVLSQLQKVRSSSSRGHQQQQGRDKDVTTMTPTSMTRALGASRKLHVPSMPGSPMSPSMMKIDINSKEYRKRVIMEGLLERKNLKGNG
jgi:hypothetical protein